MCNYNETQAMYFRNHLKEAKHVIDNNINNIKFDKLSTEEFSIILNSINVANDVICMINKNH